MENSEITQEQLDFLEELRSSGEINMMGAAPYLMEKFDLNKSEAKYVLFAWMKRA